MRGLANSLTKKAPYKGLGAESEEKHEPVSDIDTGVVDGLKALDPERPIREADVHPRSCYVAFVPIPDSCAAAFLFDHLVGVVAKAARPADAHKRLIRVWNCKFIHSQGLVLRSASFRA